VFHPSGAADGLCAPWGPPRDIAGPPWSNAEAVPLRVMGHKKELSEGTDRYFIGKVWKNRVIYRTNVSKRGPKILFKQGIQEQAAWGHGTSCLHVLPRREGAGSTCAGHVAGQHG